MELAELLLKLTAVAVKDEGLLRAPVRVSWTVEGSMYIADITEIPLPLVGPRIAGEPRRHDVVLLTTSMVDTV